MENVNVNRGWLFTAEGRRHQSPSERRWFKEPRGTRCLAYCEKLNMAMEKMRSVERGGRPVHPPTTPCSLITHKSAISRERFPEFNLGEEQRTDAWRKPCFPLMDASY